MLYVGYLFFFSSRDHTSVPFHLSFPHTQIAYNQGKGKVPQIVRHLVNSPVISSNGSTLNWITIQGNGLLYLPLIFYLTQH